MHFHYFDLFINHQKYREFYIICITTVSVDSRRFLKMQGLLARLNAQKNQGSLSKGASRSTSIASSVDDLNDEDQQSNSDESQKTSNVSKRK